MSASQLGRYNSIFVDHYILINSFISLSSYHIGLPFSNFLFQELIFGKSLDLAVCFPVLITFNTGGYKRAAILFPLLFLILPLRRDSSRMSSALSTPRFNPRSWVKTPAKLVLPTDPSVLAKNFKTRFLAPYAFDREIFTNHTSFVLPEFSSHLIFDDNGKAVIPGSAYPSCLALWLPESLTLDEYTLHEGWCLHDSAFVIYRELVPLIPLVAQDQTHEFKARLASMVDDTRPFLVRSFLFLPVSSSHFLFYS